MHPRDLGLDLDPQGKVRGNLGREPIISSFNFFPNWLVPHLLRPGEKSDVYRCWHPKFGWRVLSNASAITRFWQSSNWESKFPNYQDFSFGLNMLPQENIGFPPPPVNTSSEKHILIHSCVCVFSSTQNLKILLKWSGLMRDYGMCQCTSWT